MRDSHASNLSQRYNREAVAYRDLWAPVLRIAGRRLIEELADAPAQYILDVGTGVGSLMPDILAAFPQAIVIGLDRSAGMLALSLDGLRRAVADARHLPIASGSMDVVLQVFMLFHLQNPSDALREARRVLRPAGRVATLTWGGEMESTAGRVWTECLDAHGAVEPDPAVQSRHEQVNTTAKMQDLLHGSGFNSVRVWTDDLVCRIEMEQLLELRTRMGSHKPRFDSLDDAARLACLTGARRRMETMAPEEFVCRGEVVFAVAS